MASLPECEGGANTHPDELRLALQVHDGTNSASVLRQEAQVREAERAAPEDLFSLPLREDGSQVRTWQRERCDKLTLGSSSNMLCCRVTRSGLQTASQSSCRKKRVRFLDLADSVIMIAVWMVKRVSD